MNPRDTNWRVAKGETLTMEMQSEQGKRFMQQMAAKMEAMDGLQVGPVAKALRWAATCSRALDERPPRWWTVTDPDGKEYKTAAETEDEAIMLTQKRIAEGDQRYV